MWPALRYVGPNNALVTQTAIWRCEAGDAGQTKQPLNAPLDRPDWPAIPRKYIRPPHSYSGGSDRSLIVAYKLHSASLLRRSHDRLQSRPLPYEEDSAQA